MSGLLGNEKIVVAEIPPEGARQIGMTPKGRIIWAMDVVRGDNIPATDEAGNEVWAKHPTTGEPVYPRRKLRAKQVTKVFTLEQDGQGSLYMQDYRLPTPEELAAQEREKKVAAMVPALAAALVDSGLTAEELVARALAPKQPMQSDVAKPEDWFEPTAGENVEEPEPEVWPKHDAGPMFLLSNGMKVKGKEAAEKAQAALDAPRDNGDEVPEM